jgi:GAF domain-containing protein
MLSILRRQVGAKIILGYMITLSLMLGVGLLAISRLDQISTTVNDLTNNLALDMRLADEMVSQVLLSRFYANRYVSTQSQADLDRFDAEFSALQALLAQADQQITRPNRVEILRRIKPAVREYETAFGQVSQIIKRRQTIQAQVLGVQGLVIENKLAALRIHISTLDDDIAFFAYDNAQNAYQQMRVNLLQYLEDGDERYAVLFDKSFQEGQDAFGALESRLPDPAQVKNCADAKAALRAYYNGFETIRTDYIAMKALTSGKLDALELEITNEASEIASSVEQDFRAENEFSRQLVVATRRALLITTVLAVLIGLGLGLIVSRGITGPLQRVMRTSQQIAHVDLEALSSQLAALAQGDLRLSLDITAQPLAVQSEDEVGQMAQAFNEIISKLHQAGQTFKSTADYLNEMAGAAQAVAQGNLNVSVTARSESDVLGHAVTRMLANLREAEALVQRQLEHLEALREIDSLITTSYDLPGTLDTLLRHLTVQLRVDAAEILLLNAAAGRLECLAATGLGDVFPAPVTVNNRCVSEAVLEGRPVKLNDLKENPLDCLPSAGGQEFKVYYGLPLIAQGEIKGVLQVFGRAPFDPDPAWVNFLDTLAGQAAIAIHNFELVRNLEDRIAARTKELQHRAIQMLTAAEVSQATSSMLDLDALLQQSVNLIRERFGLYYVGLFLVDERREYAWLRLGRARPVNPCWRASTSSRWTGLR